MAARRPLNTGSGHLTVPRWAKTTDTVLTAMEERLHDTSLARDTR
jgi:hypothetical protein